MTSILDSNGVPRKKFNHVMFDLSWRWNLHVFQDWQKWWWKNIARDYCLQNFLVCIIFFMINMFHSHAFAAHILNWFPQVFWGFPWVKCPESCWPAIIMDVVSNTIQRSSKTDVRNVLNLFKGLSRYSINERAERYKDVQKKREGEKKNLTSHKYANISLFLFIKTNFSAPFGVSSRKK